MCYSMPEQMINKLFLRLAELRVPAVANLFHRLPRFCGLDSRKGFERRSNQPPIANMMELPNQS
jgi:hypothetical protein